MSYQTTGIALVAFIFLLWKYLNKTDTPKIRNLPEIPGIPLFGNLLQFGSSHAKVAGQLAKKYGPVFQVRLGNRVGAIVLHLKKMLIKYSGSCLPIALTQSDIYGLPISLLSSRGLPYILSTPWFRVPKVNGLRNQQEFAD